MMSKAPAKVVVASWVGPVFEMRPLQCHVATASR